MIHTLRTTLSRLPILAAAVLLFVSPDTLHGQSGGRAWGTVPSPNTGFGPNQLFKVDVLNQSDIWAVGSFGDFTDPEPQVQHWDGTSWQVVPLPSGLDGDLLGVAAVSANDVWFVGGEANNGHALIFHWNGTSITQVTNPNPGSYNRFYDVTAVSANDVWAVGEYAVNGGVSQTLIEHWNGSTWTQVASPTLKGNYTQFNGVSAVSANDIWAVGEAGSNTFAAHWNGTAWVEVPTPKVSFSSFRDVSADAAGVVWAVGDKSGGTLTERWTGQAWEVVPSPAPGGFFNDLTGVTVISANDVWAVGYYDVSGNFKTFAIHWDGAKWTQTGSPSPDLSYSVFNGVDADSAGNVWAVGKGEGTLVAKLNGSAFEAVPSANSGTGANNLKSISAAAPNDIWAVGTSGEDLLTMHWNGTMWTIVPTPDFTLASSLDGVVAIAANDVWAVGFTGDPNNSDSSNVILHWNGSVWSIVPSPNPGGRRLDKLHDVAAISSSNVYAVGEYVDNSGRELATILHWDGAVWTVVPNSCGPLFGISALAANDIWAVGYQSCHFDGTTWTSIPIPQDGGGITLADVSAAATNDVWAVGVSVTCDGFGCYFSSYAIHWNGTQWVLTKPPGTSLGGVQAMGRNRAVAVGTFSLGTLIARSNGKSWEEIPSPDPEAGGGLNEITSTTGKLWSVGSFYTRDFEQRTLILDNPSETQGTVVGNAGASGATISWFGATTGATTSDIFGDYGAAGLPAGSYTFVATYQTCTPVIATVQVIAGRTVRQNFTITCP